MNPTHNVTLERIYLVLGNLVRKYNIEDTYVYEDDPWSGILAPPEFKISSTINRVKIYNPGILIFGCYMILPNKHKVDWGLIHQ